MSWRLAWIEWRRLMRTPFAWIVLALASLLLGWQLLQTLDAFSSTPAVGRLFGLSRHLGLELFGLTAVLILFITPLLTMRLSDSSNSLLSTAPLRLREILLGQYLALLGVIALVALLPLGLSIPLAVGTQPDWGLLATASLGLLLLGSSFAAISLYVSSLSRTPGAAAAGSYGLLLLLSIISQYASADSSGLLSWFGWPPHFLNLQLGWVRSSDIAYFLLLSLFFLGLALHRLQLRRES
ncbi:ABC transporter permease [endosymbiont of Riftia pachyptila]|uniref:Putative ABC transporter, permease protein n=1 Tax=endosymbiont of Riftia pachyptila (vent Ph05) TaxID=1048808 RepID=G2DBB7_9GAMM|nr:ABC transporter permease subunit [endosymbiont of Riftia pachyptila]EGV52060.1 putative ABC transporter, permease protein [endosymbiont of Riftia pachyptila (vent Ph05)]